MALSLEMESDDGEDRVDPVLRPTGPIVPAANVESRALFVIVAIMAFLSCITVGAVVMLAGAAAEWRAEVGGEITVQIRPGPRAGDELARALKVLDETPGITGARALDETEIADLLEPWLGGADLSELPVPRLVVAGVDRSSPPDLGTLRARLKETAPTASLDDHELWQSRLALMADTLIVGGLILLVLVMIATVLSVVYATRGAMATNRDVVEVLHLVGAKESFIARQFERHFLRLGVRAGLAGGVVALAIFAMLRWLGAGVSATPAGDQLEAMFGAFGFGWDTVLAIFFTVALVAILTAMTSRLTVYNFLKVFD